MAIKDQQPDPFPVPHWHVERDHWPTDKKGRVTRTFTDHGVAYAYLATLPMRIITAFKLTGKRVCFDETDPHNAEIEVNRTKTATLIRCYEPNCFKGYGTEMYD